ncbi:hypothetical protein [Pelagibius marinus]|uniref:hypothetical protein n=1 Tax=Pelagibius marinus TaxID=2762760 RepID=UPI001872C5F8|nr:hypothetical protein [Pelagibius marinus]
MTLRPEYSLVHSEFNNFLFAYVGEEKSGLQLTVLSALARLGLDPWAEAARLSGLTKEAATSALTETISGLPGGDWEAADQRAIAVRLVGFLPRRSGTSAKSPQGDESGGAKSKAAAPSWVPWVMLGAALLLYFLWQQNG